MAFIFRVTGFHPDSAIIATFTHVQFRNFTRYRFGCDLSIFIRGLYFFGKCVFPVRSRNRFKGSVFFFTIERFILIAVLRLLSCRNQHIGISRFIHGHRDALQKGAGCIIVITDCKGYAGSIGIFCRRACGRKGNVLLFIRFNGFYIHAGHAGI